MLRLDNGNFVLIKHFLKMFFTCKNKNQQKCELSQLNETLDDFIFGNGTNINAIENEILKQQPNGPHNKSEKFDNDLSYNQVIISNIDDRNRNAVDNVCTAVGNCMHDAILTAMNHAVTTRVGEAVRLITASSGNGPIKKSRTPIEEILQGTPGIPHSDRLQAG